MWHELCNDFQLIINSTRSSSRNETPHFLTFFKHAKMPYSSALSLPQDLDEKSTIAARLNFSNKVLKSASAWVEQAFADSKVQYDKDVQEKRFQVGNKVFVNTSQREGLHHKLAPSFKGPYIINKILKNNNLLLDPVNGSKQRTVHKNNCKLADFRHQHLIFDEDSLDFDKLAHKTTQKQIGTTNPAFKYSAWSNKSIPDEERYIPMQQSHQVDPPENMDIDPNASIYPDLAEMSAMEYQDSPYASFREQTDALSNSDDETSSTSSSSSDNTPLDTARPTLTEASPFMPHTTATPTNTGARAKVKAIRPPTAKYYRLSSLH